VRAAVVVAGGTGERFGLSAGKQLAVLAGAPVVVHALRAIERAATIDAVVLVCHPDRVEEYREAAVVRSGVRKVVAVVPGGSTRRRSVAAGLAAVPPDAEFVVVHDGARPLLTPGLVDAALEALEARPEAAGAVVGHPAYDTIKEVGPALEVERTPDRASLWVAQTPQAFRAAPLRAAHAAAEADGFEGTDDASLVERIGGVVFMVEGPRWNVKVTLPEDLAVVEALLREGGTGDA
jgi:2-C-methyl-D-erythritol 4-phosphate cytidylyltransferase